MKDENEFKVDLQRSLSSNVEIPASLYRFAQKVPDICESEQHSPVLSSKSRVNHFSIIRRFAAVAAVVVALITTGLFVSPTFAMYMKGIPGFEIAIDWINAIRSQDGVQVAINNGYTPIEDKNIKFGGTEVTISDIYLTDEELLYKTYIRTNEYDVTDINSKVRIDVVPINLIGGGSITGSAIAETEGENKEPVLQVNWKFQLPEKEAIQFLETEKEIVFEIKKSTIKYDGEKRSRDIEKLGTVGVSVDQYKILRNKEYELNASLPIVIDDPDLKEIVLEKLTIQPTSMNVIVQEKNGITLEFMREDGMAPYLKDNKGDIYIYEPGGPVKMLEDGKKQLPFASSIFFDEDATEIHLHIGTVLITEVEPSGIFEVSKNSMFPQKVQFKDKSIVIEGAEFKEGYIHLKIKKENDEQMRLDGVLFYIPEYYEEMQKDEEIGRRLNKIGQELNINWETAESRDRTSPYLDLYIPAEGHETFSISMKRINDKVVVNQDYLIKLK